MPNTVRLTSSHDVLEVAAGGVIEVEAGGTLNLQSGARLLVAGVPAAPTDLAITNPLTTQGDLIIADGDGAPAALGVGDDGDVLTADSGAALGISWQPAGGGFDPTITDPQDGDLLQYDADSGKWVNRVPSVRVLRSDLWSPDDLAVDQDFATVLTTPAGSILLAFYFQVVTPSSAGANGYFEYSGPYGNLNGTFDGNGTGNAGWVPSSDNYNPGNFESAAYSYPQLFSTYYQPGVGFPLSPDGAIQVNWTANDVHGTVTPVIRFIAVVVTDVFV